MASISPPSTLTSFNIPQDASTTPVASSSKVTLPVTLGPVHGSEDSECVAAVQGGALWIYDLSSHRATTSFTVSPSTRFSSSPISFHTYPSSSSPTKSKQRRTVVGIAQGEDVSKDEQGKVVWIWDGDDVYEKRSTLLKHDASVLTYIPSSSSFLVTGSSGLTLLSPSLSASTTSFPSSPVASTLLLPQKSGQDSLRVLVVHEDGVVRLIRCSKVDKEEEGQVEVVGSVKIILEEGEKVVDGILEDDGYLHVYTSNNTDKPRIHPRIARIQGTSLTLTSNPTFYSLLGTSLHPISSVPTPTGHLLLSLMTTATSTSLFLFNPALPAVVTTTSLPPSSSNLSHRHLVSLSSNTFGLASFSSAAGTGERCIVSIVDVSVPAGGIGIAHLLGTAEMTKEYLEISTEPQSIQPRKRTDTDELIDSLKGTIAPGTISIAESTWNQWIRTHKLQDLEYSHVTEIVNLVFSVAIEKIGGKGEEGVKFVARPGGYAAEIVRALVSLGLVRERMWKDGGVVGGGLLSLGDWETIMIALPTISNLSSTTLVTLLHQVLHPVTFGLSQSPDLKSFLMVYHRISVSEPMHKAAMFKILNVEDVTRVLEVLVQWAEEGVDGEKVVQWDADKLEAASDGSAMRSIVTHINMILDSHLPLLVAHKPAHALLERLDAAVSPTLAIQSELQTAHGVIDAYVTLHKREEKERQVAKAKGKAKSKGGDQGVGLYRLEEIAL